jgi:hypothetical protein
VPLPALPLDTHADCPLPHDVVPVWQTFGGVPGTQGVPAVQPLHVPLSQTSSRPHIIPFCTGDAPAHIVVPEEHDVSPDMQILPLGLHTWPAVHGPQLPPLQT